MAYVKPSGVNLFSHENRLPNRCEDGCDICNPQVWAEQGNYTPTALYEFYSAQTAMLAEEFVHKDMSYMLIQAGFPKINDNGEYKEPLTHPLPKGTEQTEKILAQGQMEHGLHFVVQHNGLGVKPQDRPNPKPACPNEGVHPATEAQSFYYVNAAKCGKDSRRTTGWRFARDPQDDFVAVRSIDVRRKF